MNPPSIHLRLVLAASLVLTAFLGLTGWALDKAYRESAEHAMWQQLQGQIYALLAAAHEDREGHMRLPLSLPDPRFSNPDSGLYAQVIGEAGSYRWRSASLLGRSLVLAEEPAPGQWLRQQPEHGLNLYTLTFSIIWEEQSGREQIYTLAVAGDIAPLLNQIKSFRATLWSWLGGAALLLLLVQGAVLRWGLRPLRIIARELNRIENGKAERLSGSYPSELQRLAGNINSLIQQSRATQERYRNSLGDLAHSLKTPLAVMQGAAESQDVAQLKSTVEEQLPRMNEIVRHQLQRAVITPQRPLTQPVPIAPLVHKIIRALDKIYRERGITHHIAIAAEVLFWGAEADLMEILGNLLDNAYKYSHGEIAVEAFQSDDALTIRIEDDGPGIAADQIAQLLKRGQRADERQPGQGIGLTVAHEIVYLYQGRFELGKSRLGGVEIVLTFLTS